MPVDFTFFFAFSKRRRDWPTEWSTNFIHFCSFFTFSLIPQAGTNAILPHLLYYLKSMNQVRRFDSNIAKFVILIRIFCFRNGDHSWCRKFVESQSCAKIANNPQSRNFSNFRTLRSFRCFECSTQSKILRNLANSYFYSANRCDETTNSIFDDLIFFAFNA